VAAAALLCVRLNSTPACSVTSLGPSLPLQVFWTENRGWGVRCEVDIPVGTFVCSYVGRLCTSMEAESLEGADRYLFELEHFASVCRQVAKPADNTPSDITEVRSRPLRELWYL
jgi:SET domain